MTTPKPYRHPWIMLLLIVLLFAGLMGLCWYWYHQQLQELDQQLRQRQQQVEMNLYL